jgi:glycyl-tRNA synthetase
MDNKMDKLVALCKRRGFIYPGSEIYGGLANTYDYGPLGTELLRNIKNLWWKNFVQERSDIVGLDAGIISHHKIWEASGHVAGFADAMIDCKNCKARMRADHLIGDYFVNFFKLAGPENFTAEEVRVTMDNKDVLSLADDKKSVIYKIEGLSVENLEEVIKRNKIKCPNCGKFDWTKVRKFNLLFPVQLGIVEGEGGQAYLRGETAQGIFTNFKNVVDSSRVRLPFGIAQVGKSFRNEITPGQSVFRTIEFEQAEIEFFFDPETAKWEELFNNWKEALWEFVTKSLGVNAENLRWREHDDKERSFYSKKTEDLEYNFPFGFKELWGLAYRTDYDLTKHSEFSKKDLSIVDPQTNKKIVPHVIEPAVGINRLLLMTLLDSYAEDGERVILKLDPKLAPYKVAVFPLLANKEELVGKAREIYDSLKKEMMVSWDDRGNIGKRYFAQDEAGTPFCVTVDFQTLEDQTVTVRDRDTAKQDRIEISTLQEYLQSKLK